MACQFTNSELRAICSELSKFDPSKHHIILHSLDDKFIPVVVNAPQGGSRFFGRFYKPVECRYSTVSEKLIDLFRSNYHFFSTEGKNTINKYSNFLSKTAKNKENIVGLQERMSSSSSSAGSHTAELFRKLAATEGDCEIVCAEGSVRAHSGILKTLPWFEMMLAQPSQDENNLKIDLSQFSAGLVNSLLDRLYIGKSAELSTEAAWEFYLLQDYIGEGKNTYYFDQLCDVIKRTNVDQLFDLLLDDHTPDVEQQLVEASIERLTWLKSNLKKAASIYKKAEKQQTPYWITLKAYMTIRGVGCKKDDALGVGLLKSVGDYGPALSLLALCHKNGIFFEKNIKIAATYYAMAAEKGVVHAHFGLAKHYADSQMTQLSQKHMLIAAKGGYPLAIQSAIPQFQIKGAEKDSLLKMIREQGFTLKSQ